MRRRPTLARIALAAALAGLPAGAAMATDGAIVVAQAPEANPIRPTQRNTNNGGGNFWQRLTGGGERNAAPTTPAPATAAPAPAAQSAPAPGGGAASGNAAKRLLAAYPGAFTISGNAVVFPSGERIVFDDGRRKSPAELLTDPDVEDMFAYPYPPAARGQLTPPRDHDPGRVRNEAFFRALYGSSEGAVRGTLKSVPWVPRLGGGTMNVTTRFGVADKVAAISDDLQRLPQRFHKYLAPTGGSFLWRPIAGTNRLSVHSFGAAIDINTKFTNYWRWDKAPAGGVIPYRNQIPIEIVEVFERHCFIWGGRWYHYDTMHFEYRPELLPGCRQ
ncbi:M15 family metallopeptidase [Acuticoccus kandeliae]|uniref:M15 family metallopeptidase n=1 Tax=Acuticoccus kandeliae TaxID=2073160 RepID=UPI000D3E091C|nr:M15 family metallopeptidase [Acuticoccus kandeliae]